MLRAGRWHNLCVCPDVGEIKMEFKISGKFLPKKIIFSAIAFGVVLGLFLTFQKVYCSTDLKVSPIEASVMLPAVQLGKAFAMAANHVRPAVVSVYSEKLIKLKTKDFPFPFEEDFFNKFFAGPSPDSETALPNKREYSIPVKGMGSGIILDNSGHILTNYHVVADVEKIKVQLANRFTYSAKITQIDPNTDIAIIQLEGNFPNDLPLVGLGNSDTLRAGDLVIAVGAPFGLPQTVTQGIVSATGRSNVGIEAYEDFIQTDAPINPGNSGGPLINMSGEVVGINTAIASIGAGQSSGVGFSIPSNLIKTMLPRLLKGEKIIRGRLGLVIQDLNDDLARQFDLAENAGVLISNVQDNSPAQKAGLKPGDIIIKYGNLNISDSSQLRNLVASTTPGTEVNIKILRDKIELNIKVQIAAEEPETLATSITGPAKGGFLQRVGINVHNIDNYFSELYGIKNGAVITEIFEGSPAAFAGVQPNDVIIEANHKEVNNVGELHSILGNSEKKDSVLFLIKRQEMNLYVAIQTK